MKHRIKIFGEENIEPQAIHQFYSAMEQGYSIEGALMPDAHLGYTMPIGGVIKTNGMVLPSWVGYDIGCGVCAIQIEEPRSYIEENAGEIYDWINIKVPVGFNHRKRPLTWRTYKDLVKTKFLDRMFWDKGGLKQLGTLGGGNHFIEVGYDEADQVWLIIHSGSRNVGHSVATYYMKEACYLHTGVRKAKEWHYPFDINSQEGKDYIIDMSFCLVFALQNRVSMIEQLGGMLSPKWDTLINRTHNHAEIQDDGTVIHRKGATHAEKGMLGVIPGNMRDGSFIVEGTGCPDSLSSSSHGAGRVLSRKKAKETIEMEDFIQSMEGITAGVDKNKIDESPMAYKDIFEVMRLQDQLVKVVHHVKPILNVKG